MKILFTHSHGHKDTLTDPMYLVNTSFIIGCITDAGIFSRNDLPGTTAPQESDSDSPYWYASDKTVFVIHLLICKLFT